MVAICGSTSQQSVNRSLIEAIINLCDERFEISIYNSIGGLPQFNPEDDVQNVAKEVFNFRELLDNADGIIICTPEYAHGVPGTLKNAIDWTISSGQFPNKPTMLITAATDGKFGHKALLETLSAIEAKNIANLQLVINFAKTKISMDGRITDAPTLRKVEGIINSFFHTMKGYIT